MTEEARILRQIERDEPVAAEQLLPLVYDELKKLATARLAHERPGHTLQPTALVHEAYLRLIGDQRFDGRGHFFAAAAESMRRILVENARSKRRLKRGRDLLRVELIDQVSRLPEDPDLLLSLDELLARLGAEDEVAASVARMHLFGGLSVEEAADVLGLSRPVAYRNWKYARIWLREALGK